MASENQPLSRSPAPIRFANGTTIEGLGGVGMVRQRRPDAGRLRSATLPAELDTSPAFDRALDAIGIREQETIDLDSIDLRAGATDRIALTPARAPGDTAPRIVLYQDDSGGVSWHFERPVATTGTRPGLRGGAAAPSIEIPLRSRATQATLRQGMPRRALRGPITKIGRKIFKVLVLPVASLLLEDPVRWLGEKVENRFRRNLIWQVTPENYRTPPTQAFTDWNRLREGPALLIVHGIFSSAEGMLSGLPKAAMERWHAAYDGRVIAFNHPTVSVSPEDNARTFLDALEQGLPNERATFDILCHSRGGIVSRTLAERAGELVGSNGCAVRSVYFVATPNNGSPLGDADHLVDMIDLFTNCLSAFPDGPVTFSLEVIVGVVALLGHAAASGLPGIAALGTKDSYITDTLNRGLSRADASYAAAASDFEPQPGRENGWLIDRVMDPVIDRVFEIDGRRIPNDLVVPQQGVFAANGHPSFPIADPVVFDAADGIWHTAFFKHPRTIEHIDRFLAGVAQSAEDRSRPEATPSSSPQPAEARRIVRGRLRTRKSGQPKGKPGSPSTTKAPPAGNGGTPPRVAQDVPQTVERDPWVDFHERVEAGRTEDLMVQLTLPGAAPAPAGRMSLEFEVGTEEIELTAELSAPGFRIEGACRAVLRILRERDETQETATFRLTALDPGPAPVERAIDVSFWVGNHCVGGVRHHTVVVPVGNVEATINAPDVVSVVRLSSRVREPADLVVTVRQPDKRLDFFELEMRSQVFGEEYESRQFGSFDVEGKQLSTYLSEALDPSFARFPGEEIPDEEFEAAVGAWNARFLIKLGDLGKQLWTHLPKEFREEYLRLAALDNPPGSIVIFSDELTFPWEIVRPSGKIRGTYRELPPLGAAHTLGRWRPSTGARPQPQALPVAKMAILVPDANDAGLPWAADEVNQLQALLPAAMLVAPVRRTQVDSLLASSDVQVVHFSGHGLSGPNADLTALVLEAGDEITAMAFAANALGSNAQPVLYLNACTVGRGGRVMGRSGGFAGNCIEAGWSGVVAPYWPVYDPSAAEFGVAFYRKLKAGRAIGEALQELRSERQDDPTALSYAYFGDPFARLRFE